jgi:hypothetical protein
LVHTHDILTYSFFTTELHGVILRSTDFLLSIILFFSQSPLLPVFL